MAAPAEGWHTADRFAIDGDPSERDRAVIAAALGGEAAARQALMTRVHGLAIAICVRRGLDRRGHDVASDVALRVVDRVLARDLAALRRFEAADTGASPAAFERWITALVANAFVDHLRSQPEAIRRGTAQTRRLERVLVGELDAERTAAADALLSAIEARQLLELAAQILGEAQRAALVLWLRGEDAAEIAAHLGLDGAAAAHRLLHSMRERLRRALREEAS